MIYKFLLDNFLEVTFNIIPYPCVLCFYPLQVSDQELEKNEVAWDGQEKETTTIVPLKKIRWLKLGQVVFQTSCT